VSCKSDIFKFKLLNYFTRKTKVMFKVSGHDNRFLTNTLHFSVLWFTHNLSSDMNIKGFNKLKKRRNKYCLEFFSHEVVKNK
jgi:hypothetical protein